MPATAWRGNSSMHNEAYVQRLVDVLAFGSLQDRYRHAPDSSRFQLSGRPWRTRLLQHDAARLQKTSGRLARRAGCERLSVLRFSGGRAGRRSSCVWHAACTPSALAPPGECQESRVGRPLASSCCIARAVSPGRCTARCLRGGPTTLAPAFEHGKCRCFIIDHVAAHPPRAWRTRACCPGRQPVRLRERLPPHGLGESRRPSILTAPRCPAAGCPRRAPPP
jgi:hypothetical protein